MESPRARAGSLSLLDFLDVVISTHLSDGQMTVASGPSPSWNGSWLLESFDAHGLDSARAAQQAHEPTLPIRTHQTQQSLSRKRGTQLIPGASQVPRSLGGSALGVPALFGATQGISSYLPSPVTGHPNPSYGLPCAEGLYGNTSKLSRGAERFLSSVLEGPSHHQYGGVPVA
jgi:hypothetical protein